MGGSRAVHEIQPHVDLSDGGRQGDRKPGRIGRVAKLGSQCGWTVNLAGQMRDGMSAACASVARTAKMSSTAARISDNDDARSSE